MNNTEINLAAIADDYQVREGFLIQCFENSQRLNPSTLVRLSHANMVKKVGDLLCFGTIRPTHSEALFCKTVSAMICENYIRTLAMTKATN